MPTMPCSTANPTMVEHRSRGSDRERRIEMTARARPPFAAELEPALDAVPAFFTTLEPDSIAEFRAATTHPSSLEEVIAGRPIQVTDHAATPRGCGGSGGSISSTVAAWSAGADGRSHRSWSSGSSSSALSRPPLSTVSHPSSPTRCPSRTATRGWSGSPATLTCSASTRDECSSVARAPEGASAPARRCSPVIAVGRCRPRCCSCG
jgi:hypothetical protein